jgi:hypothetical protein
MSSCSWSGRLTRTRIVARLVVPPVSQRAHGADYAPKHYSDQNLRGDKFHDLHVRNLISLHSVKTFKCSSFSFIITNPLVANVPFRKRGKMITPCTRNYFSTLKSGIQHWSDRCHVYFCNLQKFDAPLLMLLMFNSQYSNIFSMGNI